MKFGLVYSFQSAKGGLAQLYQDALAQVELAEKLGFDSVFVSEHHLTSDGYFPSVMESCAGMATRTKRIRIGTAVVLLPLNHPLHVAEDSAVLDIISQGRFILGVGLGYRQVEFAAFQVPLKERVSRFEEAIPLIRRLWSDTEVTHQGKHWPMDKVNMTPKPIQKPGPPIWIAAKKGPAVRRAARMGDAWFADPVTPFTLLKERVLDYKEGLAQAGKDFSKVEFPIFKESYIARDGKTAWRECEEHILYIYKEYMRWGHLVDEAGQAVKSEKDPVFERLRERFIVGSPSQCLEQIQRHQEELGVNHIILRIQSPDLEHKKVMRAIRLFGEKVIPHFS